VKYTTVIFDLDGTLLDTLEDIKDTVNYALRQFGYPERTLEQVRLSVGNGTVWLLEKSLPMGGDTPEFSDILACYMERYRSHPAEKTRPYDGVCELLRELSRREYKLAVVSNKPDKIVKSLVNKFFGGVISVAIGDREGVRRKPAPDSVIAAEKELFSAPWECVYVGDSEVDLATAKNAGIDCISVSWGFRSREFLSQHGAVYMADKPADVAELV